MNIASDPGRDKTRKLFLSYPQEDSETAVAVCSEFQHAGEDAWCYELDGACGADFREEYTRRIWNSTDFILFDSPQARRSEYVREECATALEAARDGRARITICLTAPPDDWRADELFPRQNDCRYIDFTKYEIAVERLFRHLGVAYHPRFTEPRGREFFKEVRTAPLDVDVRQDLINAYMRYVGKSGTNRTVAEAQLVVLIDSYLHDRDLPIVAPYLELGVLYGGNGRHEEAQDLFRRVTERFPGDPRGWAGLGGASFALGRFGAAVTAFEESVRCVHRSSSSTHRDNLAEVVANLAGALMAVGRHAEARNVLLQLPTTERTKSPVMAQEGKALMLDGRMGEALVLFERALETCTDEQDVNEQLLLDLAECCRVAGATERRRKVLELALNRLPDSPEVLRGMAVYCSDIGAYAEALAYYERAEARASDDPRLYAEQALLLHSTGQGRRRNRAIERGLASVQLAASDGYYVGLLHYLAGRHALADYFFSTSVTNPALAGWSHYRDLG